MRRPIPESYWVDPEHFLAGEHPAGFENPASVRRRIDAFLQAGIDTFYDLTRPHELAPYERILRERAAAHGIDADYARFAIRDHHVPSPEKMAALLKAIEAAMLNGRTLYVHCWGGIGRTGMVVGCHLVRRGMSAENALAQVGQLFKTMPKHLIFPSSPETEAQIEFVRNWREAASIVRVDRGRPPT